MKLKIFLLALFVALTANTVSAQYREQVVSRTYEPGVYSDERGQYRWQIIEKRVWIPEYQTRGILGIGVRTIPGHYEMRTERRKIYTNGSDYYGDGDNNGRKGRHPHGMPPGQRKKMQNNY